MRIALLTTIYIYYLSILIFILTGVLTPENENALHGTLVFSFSLELGDENGV